MKIYVIQENIRRILVYVVVGQKKSQQKHKNYKWGENQMHFVGMFFL